jgi:hypothetical protein
MTETTKNTTRSRHNIFATDFNAQTDDFLLADIPITTDDTKLTITPLHHLVDEEDAIDRLLLNSGFNSSRVDVAAPLAAQHHNAVVEPIEVFNEPTDDVATFDLIAPEPAHAEQQITDSPALDNDNTEPLSAEPLIDDPDDFFTRVETDSAETAKPTLKHAVVRHKNRHQPAKHNTKATTFISYAALVLAIAALISTFSLTMMLNDLKTDVAKLTELVEIIRDDIATLTEKNR